MTVSIVRTSSSFCGVPNGTALLLDRSGKEREVGKSSPDEVATPVAEVDVVLEGMKLVRLPDINASKYNLN